MEKDSIVFYKSFYEAIKEMPKENQLEIYNAIFEKYFFNNEIKLNGLSKGIFQIIKPNIDSANKRYFANIENGKKGGRPKKKNSIETQIKPNKNPIETQIKPNENPIETQHKSQQNLNVNDNDNVNDNVNVKDKENVKDNINKKEKNKKETEFDQLINQNFTDEEVKNTVYEFIKMRKAIKKPLTTKGLELMIKKLYSLSTNIDEQIQILNNSIMNNWQGIFSLTKETKKNNNKIQQRHYTEEDFNKLYSNFN